MKADIQPRWLVSLMCQWARRELSNQDGGTGYPKQVAFLLVPTGTNSRTDPTGESARDFAELEAALAECMAKRIELWATLMMYYKPWALKALQAEGYPFGNSTYFKRLHIAHAFISDHILGIDEKKLAIA
jgi:hypothetical protein